MSNPHSLEQQRAAHALRKVRELEQPLAPFAKNYRSYVESLPASIVTNGLGQACATLLSGSNGEGDRGNAYRELHAHLQDWLCRQGGVYSQSSPLIDAITSNGQLLRYDLDTNQFSNVFGDWNLNGNPTRTYFEVSYSSKGPSFGANVSTVSYIPATSWEFRNLQ